MVHFALRIQFGDALPYPVLISVVDVASHVPLQPMFAGDAGLPDDFDPDVAAPPLLIQRDLFDHQPHDLFAIRRGSAGGAP